MPNFGDLQTKPISSLVLKFNPGRVIPMTDKEPKAKFEWKMNTIVLDQIAFDMRRTMKLSLPELEKLTLRKDLPLFEIEVCRREALGIDEHCKPFRRLFTIYQEYFFMADLPPTNQAPKVNNGNQA